MVSRVSMSDNWRVASVADQVHGWHGDRQRSHLQSQSEDAVGKSRHFVPDTLRACVRRPAQPHLPQTLPHRRRLEHQGTAQHQFFVEYFSKEKFVELLKNTTSWESCRPRS